MAGVVRTPLHQNDAFVWILESDPHRHRRVAERHPPTPTRESDKVARTAAPGEIDVLRSTRAVSGSTATLPRSPTTTRSSNASPRDSTTSSPCRPESSRSHVDTRVPRWAHADDRSRRHETSSRCPHTVFTLGSRRSCSSFSSLPAARPRSRRRNLRVLTVHLRRLPRP